MGPKSIAHLTALILVLSTCSAASDLLLSSTRDESSEDTKTEFNLATTLTGDIAHSRHHARANLDSQLYPNSAQHPYLGRQTTQLAPIPYAPAGNDIDEPHGHDRSNSGVGLVDLRSNNRVGTSGYAGGQPSVQTINYPGRQPYGVAQPGWPAASYGGSQPGLPTVGYPGAQPGLPVPAYIGVQPNLPRAGQRGAQPGFPSVDGGLPFQQPPRPVPHPTGLNASPFGSPQYSQYPGQYLPQYPALSQPVPFPAYSGYGGAGASVVAHPQTSVFVPAISYQNHHQYPPGHNLDHTFKMATEYKEDGVHKGPFDVLNNHNAYGYGSGYGGGYNGAFNTHGY